jgi:hypothetical protein
MQMCYSICVIKLCAEIKILNYLHNNLVDPK